MRRRETTEQKLKRIAETIETMEQPEIITVSFHETLSSVQMAKLLKSCFTYRKKFGEPLRLSSSNQFSFLESLRFNKILKIMKDKS